MNAYELADIIEDDMEDGFGMGFLKDAVSMIRQQADRISELEKDLHMVERHYDQLKLPDGYVVVCVHCAKELNIEFNEPTDLEAKITKYEEVLQAIANDYHELSDHKIEVQVRNHKKWAREALSLSGNNADDVGNTNETLPKGKE